MGAKRQHCCHTTLVWACWSITDLQQHTPQTQIHQNCHPAADSITDLTELSTSNAECLTPHRQVRRLERLFWHTNSPLDWENLVRFVHQMHTHYRERETAHCTGSRRCPPCEGPEASLGHFQWSPCPPQFRSPLVYPTFSAADFMGYCENKISSVHADTAGSPSEVPTECAASPLVEQDLLLWASLDHHVVGSEVLWAGSAAHYLDPGPCWWPTFPSHPPLQQIRPGGILPNSQKRSIIFQAVKRNGLELKTHQTFVPFKMSPYIENHRKDSVWTTNYLHWTPKYFKFSCWRQSTTTFSVTTDVMWAQRCTEIICRQQKNFTKYFSYQSKTMNEEIVTQTTVINAM